MEKNDEEEIIDEKVEAQIKREKKLIELVKRPEGATFSVIAKEIGHHNARRYIKRFLGTELIFKEGKSYFWFELRKKTAMPEFVEHAKKVVEAIDLLTEDFNTIIFRPPYVRRVIKNSSGKEEVVLTAPDGSFIEDIIRNKWILLRQDLENISKISMLKEHLRTGYPEIYAILEECRILDIPARDELIMEIYTLLGCEQKALSRFYKSHQKLAAELGKLKAQLMYGHSLKGECSVCKES
ncbi:MAG: hypothetical protein QXO75_02575 [Nitrososphaerota archaeon]